MQAAEVEKHFSDLLDSLLSEFEVNLSQIHRKKEIKHGAAVDDPSVIQSFQKEISDAVLKYKDRMDRYLEELSNLKKHTNGLKMQERRNESNAKLPSIDSVDLTTRKYGIVLQTSTDGKIYKIHQQSVYCGRCGEKVTTSLMFRLLRAPMLS